MGRLHLQVVYWSLLHNLSSMPAKTLSSAAVVCYVNGSLYGKVTGFRFTSAVNRRVLHSIDTLEPFELTPGPTKISGQIRLLRLIDDGGAEGAFTAHFNNLSAEQYFSFVLLDRGTGVVIFKASQCSILNQSWEFPSKGIVTGSIEFEALDWSNEVP